MRTIRLQEPKVEADWNKRLLDKNDFTTLIEGPEEVEVFSPEGEQICVILRNCVDMDIIKKSWPIIRKINMKTENRGSASGISAVARVKQDGTLSKTTRVPKGYEAISGVIGYYPRYPRIPYCRECAWNIEHPAEWDALLPLFQAVNGLHKQYSPESYKLQEGWAKKTSSDFMIPGTIYTTVTVNKNFRTASHLDAKNLYDGMTPMLLLRQGKYSGGHVVLPEWKIAAHLNTNDLIIFRNMKDYHGNTPIVPLSENHQRCTLVFYYREEMIKCGSAEQELDRAKRGEDFSKDFSEDRLCGNCDKQPCSPQERAECFKGGRS